MPTQPIVKRVVEVIRLLSDRTTGLSVTEVSDTLEMPASAAHRVLNELAREGVVAQDEASRRYRLTLALPSYGMRYLSGLGFVEVCQPTVDALARESKELVRLTMVEGRGLIWVAKAQGARSVLRIDPMAGRSAIPHVTAAGKSWLATLSDAEAVAAVEVHGFGTRAQYGPNLLDTPAALLADLALCRRRGYAVTYEEAEPGVAAVAAAITPAGASAAFGTISVAGPTARLRRKDLDRMAPTVIAAAEELACLWPARRYTDQGEQRDMPLRTGDWQ